MKKLVCNYSVIRFMPYPETEEFVCVGVVLLCLDARYFNYKLEMKRRERVTGFFPELEPNILIQGRRIFEQQLQHVHKILGGDDETGQMRFGGTGLNPAAIFKDLVRPRESLFRFSGIGAVLTEDPAREIERLYDHYVNRQFAQRDEFQEMVMARHLWALFRAQSVPDYKSEFFGNDTYKFKIPFVQGEIQAPASIKAIKPLNFAQNDTTRITDHGYIWQKRIEILLDQNVQPDRIMLPVKSAAEDRRAAVARNFCEKFEKLGVRVIEFGRQGEIVEFAKAK